MKKRRIMEVLVSSKGERLRQAVVTHADTTKKAMAKAKKFSSEFPRSEGNLWIESVDAPATQTKPGEYRKIHYVEALRSSKN